MNITVIIPTLNEAKNIRRLLRHLKNCSHHNLVEVIVVDANSNDGTHSVAREYGAKVIKSDMASRAHQMNLGAKVAKGALLYFVHADAIPPISFVKDILNAVEKECHFGCYRFKFESKSLLLAINSFFTRFPFLWCRGGDQTLFIRKDIFQKEGGYDENYIIMEDFELIKRLWKKYSFTIIPKSVVVSARKYNQNGYFQVTLANLKVVRMFNKGQAPALLKKTYHELIKHSNDGD